MVRIKSFWPGKSARSTTKAHSRQRGHGGAIRDVGPSLRARGYAHHTPVFSSFNPKSERE